MKQYLLLLRSADFAKSGTSWMSNAFNLYSNSQFNNYSYTRSAYGLNLVGDRTFVGTEITSPSSSVDIEDSTPIASRSVYKTDLGEVVYEQSTPSLLRFIDTTSRIDILSYTYSFTNIAGNYRPSFNITFYESDSADGPWLTSSISSDTGIVLIRNCKPYIKLELEIVDEGIDLSYAGLVFFLEVGIHDPVSPVSSKTVKNILRRFPTWTSVWEDSEDSATPSLDIPESVGGKFLTALVQEGLDRFDSEIILNDINSYISSADENMISWIYVANGVPQNINKIYGNGIELARVSNFNELLRGKTTDYAFYYNPIDRTLFTLRNFGSISVNQTSYSQEPINVFNQFDEFGARLALPRLYLESNSNYKKRILDVTQNIGGVSLEAFKRTLRRELDIWRAYGTTPDSNYLGATPEVLDIYDIENSTPYFSESGLPQREFINFVEDLNKKYPSNWGYVRWNEGVWDYAGKNGEGVSRISAAYDVATPLGNLYQAGVGDFDDLKAIIAPLEHSTVSFDGSISISGFRETSEIDIYTPIIVPYSWYIGYETTASDSIANQAKAGLVYELSLKAHGDYATPSTFYANLNYLNRSDFTVTNNFLSSNWATPEYNYIRIFNNDGYTVNNVEFYNKIYDESYYNSTPNNKHSINISNINSVNVVIGKEWDVDTQSYIAITDLDPFDVSMSSNPVSFIDSPTPGYEITLSSPNLSYGQASVLIASNKYFTKQVDYNSDSHAGSLSINSVNSIGVDGISSSDILIPSLIEKTALAHSNATPKYIYINGQLQTSLTAQGSSDALSAIGGRSIHPINDDTYLVPASPSITFTPQDISGTDLDTANYFEHATINYLSQPNRLHIESVDSVYYPLKQMQYEYFEASSTPGIYSGFIDENDNVFKSEEEYNNSFNMMDRYLETINIDRDTFGIQSSTVNYYVDYIHFATTPNYIDTYVLDPDSTMADISNAFNNDTEAGLDIYAEKDEVRENQYNIGLHPGNLYMNHEDYFLYVDPITVESNGKFFELDLPSIPRHGAPVIAKINSQNLRHIAFEDSATPGKISFSNTESLYGNKNNSLYLAYQDLSNISIVDTYSGITLFNNLSTETNVIAPFDSATPSIFEREYEVTYYLNNAFYVDKNVYDSSSDSYGAVAHFSSTPDSDSDYQIIYENNIVNKVINTNLDLSLTSLPVNEGFIFISNEDYAFDSIEAYLSPSKITDSLNDFMYLSITSYDVNGNFKPGQTFRIYGDYITADDEYLTTNSNGFESTIVRYSGAIPSPVTNSVINIEGIGSSDPNGGINSQSDGYSDSLEFDIIRNVNFNLSVKASATILNATADSVTKIGVVGKVLWKGKPFNHEIPLKWRKARTLYDLFNTATINYGVSSNADGQKFSIDAFTAESSLNPGHWLCAIELDVTAEEIQALLLLDGESVSVDDITITGDIIYWNEKYDNIHYVNESSNLPASILHVKQDDSDLIATPNFVYSHHNSSDIQYIESNPAWNLPTWVPLRKFDQYQLGLFGSTPNLITDFSNIHPDSGEE
jgi:hypothetical protein